MKYMIEHLVLYDESDDSLQHKATNDKIILPATAARVLSYLINNQGIVLSREQILTDVWDKHGYQPSNNSLTQYVSYLRKSFQNIDISPDSIITVPRIGLLLSENIAIQKITTPVGIEKTSRSVNKFKLFLKYFKHKIVHAHLSLIFFYLSLAILLISTFFYSLGASNSIPKSDLYQIGYIGTCPLYTLYPEYSNDTIKSQIKFANSIAKEFIKCRANDMYLFQREKSISQSNKGRSFLSRCTLNVRDSNYITECKDMFYYD